jgi:predicted TIM-barrel fold metal-dependent hydrolase
MHDTNSPLDWMPPNACDCHTHAFEAAAAFPYSAARSYTPALADGAMLARHLARAGMHRVVVVQPSVYGADHRAALHTIASIGRARARGVAAFDDVLPTANEIDALHEGGMRGLRLNFEIRHLQDARVAADQLHAAATLVRGRGWHLQVHARLSLVARLLPVLVALGLPVVLDHYAGAAATTPVHHPDFAALLSAMHSGQLNVKLSAGHLCGVAHGDFQALAPLTRALARQHADHLVWGSDWPHPNPDAGCGVVAKPHVVDDLAALVALREHLGDTARLHQVLVANPSRLYDFGGV